MMAGDCETRRFDGFLRERPDLPDLDLTLRKGQRLTNGRELCHLWDSLHLTACVNIRSTNAAGVSSSSTGTTRFKTIGPYAYRFSAKCIVQLLTKLRVPRVPSCWPGPTPSSSITWIRLPASCGGGADRESKRQGGPTLHPSSLETMLRCCRNYVTPAFVDGRERVTVLDVVVGATRCGTS